ncbi:proline--tRNA ligase, partial [Streptococcus suis]|nr:proline--tRNA ligase [Streptococcus suis]
AEVFFDVGSRAYAEIVLVSGFGYLGCFCFSVNIIIFAERNVQVVKIGVVGDIEVGLHYPGANAGRYLQVNDYVDIRELKEG